MKKISVWRVAPLLFITGLCSLTYQVVWLRQLRLIFGSSTAATGIVLAVFMGGLGFGAFLLGKYADKSKNPLNLFGRLETGIALSAILSPLFIVLIEKFYIFLGGTTTLGLFPAAVVRVTLTFIVLGIPTLLMGGTLPAIAQAVETSSDHGRRNLALLYGINTLGGVLGVGLATFYFLEQSGNRATLWSASMLNLLAALLAMYFARHFSTAAHETENIQPAELHTTAGVSAESKISPNYVYIAALIAGFAFLLMELVWYRMLSPLLGGSTFTFSLILATALAGIGIGGYLYSTRDKNIRPSLASFASVCALEALFIAIPFWLGDWLAVLTAMLKPLGLIGFHGQVAGWLSITGIMVFLPAVMSGIQFPMLIGILGQGSRHVGKDTGNVYAWNTLGAIIGALAGGLGLIPLLSATGCWQLVAVLLVLLAFSAVTASAIIEGHRFLLLPQAAIVLLTCILLSAPGPTATWRHRAIGAGPGTNFTDMDQNDLLEWRSKYPRSVLWEKDGLESSVALRAYNGLSFIINGKPDGHSISDAGTQVMGPLVGALLHKKPQNALVIGLGTGSSAGWLAEVPTMEQVDVVELEPAILKVAEENGPVNFNVTTHPKVNIIFGDAREITQTAGNKYDLVFSEPSNPYRAGIASLYTREFYEAVSEGLAQGGIFSQWVQSYHVDQQTIRTITATLASVFEYVEIWLTNSTDLLFVCSNHQREYKTEILQQRVSEEPFRTALLQTWGVSGLEGFLAGFIGRPEVARQIYKQEVQKKNINTDDRMLVEFGFARTAGKTGLFSLTGMKRSIRVTNHHRPATNSDQVDWNLVDENYFRMMLWVEPEFVAGKDDFTPEQQQRISIFRAFSQGDFNRVASALQSGLWKTDTPLEKAVAAQALAEFGDESAIRFANEINAYWPATTNAILARFYLRRGEQEKAFDFISSALQGFRTDPWQVRPILFHTLNMVVEMAYSENNANELYNLIETPFSVYNAEEYRKFALAMVGKSIDYQHAASALAQLEPHIPWNEAILSYRAECYDAVKSPLAERANQELQLFLKNKAQPFKLL